MDIRRQPIGFFDSGIGGLSVLLHAAAELKNENFIYYGDSANAPYGERSEEEIKRLSLDCGAFLFQKGVKAIVMACNTATSASVKLMREKYQIPVISIEPAVKPAAENAQNGKILVMATPATLAQKRYNSLVERVGCAGRVINMPCGGLAGLLEAGDFDAAEVEQYIRRKFKVIEGEEIDGIVMGCTHYSFISPQIHSVALERLRGKREIYDGMYGTVRQLGRVLCQNRLQSPGPGGAVALYTSGTAEDMRVMRHIIASRAGWINVQ